jgi:tetratricopeptide (TPR) repeat protein
MDSRSAVFVLSLLLGLPSCNTEILRQQEEQIKAQQEEIARQRKEIEELAAAKKREEQKRLDCNRAFRDFFDKAQASDDRQQAVSLYREGLGLCPDDDVAHYELGKALSDLGRYAEAEKEFAAAVTLNPDFQDAEQQLEAVRKKR